MLEVFTYQVMWVAVVTYCPILAPKGLLATMTGVTGATHYSLGKGSNPLFVMLVVLSSVVVYGYVL